MPDRCTLVVSAAGQGLFVGGNITTSMVSLRHAPRMMTAVGDKESQWRAIACQLKEERRRAHEEPNRAALERHAAKLKTRATGPRRGDEEHELLRKLIDSRVVRKIRSSLAAEARIS